MSKNPKLAIVGRPNVGKSALFNRICKKRISIVDEMEGVTRDRLYASTDLFGIPFDVIDTGGIDPRSKAPFNEEVKRQAEIAIEEADTIVMVVDAQIGITQLDEELSRILKRTTKPLCLAVNKIDDHQKETEVFNFQGLGITKKIAVSAAQNWHIAELLEAALEELPPRKDSDKDDLRIKIAIIGRPNVGKSSLANAFLEEERCIVSPLAGTTRDSVDISFHDGEFTLIDTAGIKRKGAEKDVVEKFSSIRTQEAIKRADVCLLMLDANQGMTTQEKRIATQIEEAGKGCLILFNKWDLVSGFRMEHCMQAVEKLVPFLKHCPKLFISATQQRNLDKILPYVRTIHTQAHQRIDTSELNTFIEKCILKTHPPMIDGKRLRIYYMAQVEVHPPRFVLFVNHPRLLTATYNKYLINQFRKEYGFDGVPLRFFIKAKR